MVVGHFFLFCNVFRIRTRLELIWVASFLANVMTWVGLQRLDWAAMLVIQIPITGAVIAYEMRSPSYHGVFARRINRDLDRYLARAKGA